MKKILCILLLSFLFLTACNAGGDDTVVVGLPQDPDYLDPHRAVGAGTREMLFNIFEGLMKQNPDGSLSEALAESYTISEDKTTYTFTLRKGVLFHNGEPVTPEDVVYSYERLSGQFDGTVYAEGLEGVLVTSAGNDVTFTLPEPNGAFLSEMIGPVIPNPGSIRRSSSRHWMPSSTQVWSCDPRASSQASPSTRTRTARA